MAKVSKKKAKQESIDQEPKTLDQTDSKVEPIDVEKPAKKEQPSDLRKFHKFKK